MTNREGVSSKKVVLSVLETAISGNGTTNGGIIDTQGYDSVTFVFYATAYTDGTYTPLINESDDSGMSGEGATADAELHPTEANAAITAAITNGVQTGGVISYLGNRRYVTCDIVASAVTCGATVGCLCILERASVGPTA